MTQPRSAGVILYRLRADVVEVLLILPGGPFWRRREDAAWQMPKGAIEPGETAVQAAFRELHEELGVQLADETPRPLCTVRQAGGKRVEAFAVERDWDVADLVSNLIKVEWPPRSGRIITVPEVGEARWMPLREAESAMLLSQRPILAALEALLIRDGRIDPPNAPANVAAPAGRAGKRP